MPGDSRLCAAHVRPERHIRWKSATFVGLTPKACAMPPPSETRSTRRRSVEADAAGPIAARTRLGAKARAKAGARSGRLLVDLLGDSPLADVAIEHAKVRGPVRPAHR